MSQYVQNWVDKMICWFTFTSLFNVKDNAYQYMWIGGFPKVSASYPLYFY